jgi:hypothetical protein
MNSLENPVAELKRIIEAAGDCSICLRGMGGIAFEILCNTSQYPIFTREYKDFDLATRKKDTQMLGAFFQGVGYVPDEEFNLLNGDLRQIYFDPERGRHIDIFIEQFDMCHKIPFGIRLDSNIYTLSPADLFLTKAQIVQINQKDITDIIRLLITHLPDDNKQNCIDLSTITQLTSRDWGLYTTVNLSLDKVEQCATNSLGKILSNDHLHLLLSNIQKIRSTMYDEPKSQSWKLRSKFGTKLKWYQDVEEVELS